MAVALTAKQYRERAEESRTFAEQMSDPEARFTMLRIAFDYEDMANRMEAIKDATPGIDKSTLDRAIPNRRAE